MSSWQGLKERLYGLRRFGIEPGLERIRAALVREGLAALGYQVIIVAGTNGKGTVASMIAAMLQAQGHSVGLYTSPHLIDVCERFRVNGRPLKRAVVQSVLAEFLARYDEAPRQGKGPGPALTFFEMTTLMGARLFAEAGVDCAVLEVGLGGRLDAVNAMDGDVAVVTPIGRDHTEYLGESIAEIAGEKAGIFRRGRPAIIGIQEEPQAATTLKAAAQKVGAIAVDAAKRAEAEAVPESYRERHRHTARLAVEALNGEAMSPVVIDEAMGRWRWPGRGERVARRAGQGDWVVDAAHNPAGLAALAKEITRRGWQPQALVWGGMADKSVDGVDGLFRALNKPVWGALIGGERARGASALKSYVPEQLWAGADEVAPLVRYLDAEISGDILVFGSVYLVGQWFQAIGRTPAQLVTYQGD